MDFIDRLRELSSGFPRILENINTEEATKHAMIMPFISALGYNVFDPTEVTPELCADVGVKKGEKVDYAILKEGKPVILFECKHHSADLNKIHASQLYRYFSVTDARFGVLTNGVAYKFFTDLEAPNKMDEKPFFEFNMLEIKELAVDELKKFSKSSFDVSNILTTAAELKYTREIKRIMLDQISSPSEEFIRFFVSKIYGGRSTQSIKDQFTPLIAQAFSQLIADHINEKLKTAFNLPSNGQQPLTEVAPIAPPNPVDNNKNEIATTVEELEGYHIIKALLRESVAAKRIVMRDVQSYCGILLDDNNRKPICRLYFNTANKYASFFDTDKEEKILIEGVDDLYGYAERLKASVAKYEGKVV